MEQNPQVNYNVKEVPVGIKSAALRSVRNYVPLPLLFLVFYSLKVHSEVAVAAGVAPKLAGG